MENHKIINDPVYGFINIPGGLLLNLVNHPFMQRLTRIKQLGLTSAVYPGAQHTRFQHSIGAFHLMSEAITSLIKKGVFISEEEAEAVEAAILLHDIGHGPFSHVLENTLIREISHEEISLVMMEKINHEMNGALTLALKIFKDEYPKRFLHQLISSQLDMDRLDYLRRDCFFTGVAEGNIGSARIIKMLNVADDRLVIESKGIYSIENYLTSRRLMYWQVYLHKTSVSCERLLVNTLLRAKQLTKEGKDIFASPPLKFFIENDVDESFFKKNPSTLKMYENLDDNDIWSSVKVWMHSEDKVLSILSKDLINRNIFKVEVYDQTVPEEKILSLQKQIAHLANISFEDAKYLMGIDTIQKDMYDVNDDHIAILYTDHSVKDVSEASDILNVSLLSKKNRKYYLCSQRF